MPFAYAVNGATAVLPHINWQSTAIRSVLVALTMTAFNASQVISRPLDITLGL
jgi:hypothetical protein